MSTESEKRLHRCCFTGHRPEKLAEDKKKIIKALERAIISAINEGYTTFISGMSRGTDIWAAEIVLKLRRKYSIKLKIPKEYLVDFLVSDEGLLIAKKSKKHIDLLLDALHYINMMCAPKKDA